MKSTVVVISAIYDKTVLAEFLNSTWLSVSPGHVGPSAIYSLAFGLPVLAARVEPYGPEVAAVHDRVNGYFFPSDDPKALAALLVALSLDNDRWQEMAKAARQIAQERLGTANILPAFEQVIRYAQRREDSVH